MPHTGWRAVHIRVLKRGRIMTTPSMHRDVQAVPQFKREFFTGKECFTRIGAGEIGGKAHGLLTIMRKINHMSGQGECAEAEVGIPRLSVITTHFFDLFMEQNSLYDLPYADMADERIAHHFQAAVLPADLSGDLYGLISKVHTPLAVRSSSLLEDSLETPFAGIYATKMIPNNQPDTESRFHKLVEAIKYVYSSTFFKQARDYAAATGNDIFLEKMAVIIQEVAGIRRNDRFYPTISGVARSYNFYPFGRAKPEQGIVQLALGLGKTIVDGGLSWSFSPAHPTIDPPHNSVQDLLKQTQTAFWAVNMGGIAQYDPVNEDEYLVQGNLADAEYDNVLSKIASTYDAHSDRVYIGTGRQGPRIVSFGPVLHFNEPPLTRILKKLLPVCEEAAGGKVEIEFAVTIDRAKGNEARFRLLQVRRMALSDAEVDIGEEGADRESMVACSNIVLGNGRYDDIRDIVYVKPEAFDFGKTALIAGQLETINRQLLEQKRLYMLAGFGRWGSTDPWLGIPVAWGQISGAKVIVESFHGDKSIDFSQGSHFFHNISNLHIMYLYIKKHTDCFVDWKWLAAQQTVSETEYINHIRLKKPATVIVSLKQKRGVVLK